MYKFLTLTPEEQVAQLKKEAEEWARRREQFRKAFANRPKGGNNNNNANKGGNKGGGNGQRGGGGGPGGGGPPGGWGGGGGGGSAAASFGSRNDSVSPESRAGGAYKMGLSQQLGIGFGGRGGGPGGGKR